MATKRIYQIAKEFERDEKAIIEFLTGQGIKVGNRLSAVSEEAYEMLKTKFLAPPEPEPAPEPVKTPAPVEQAQAQPQPQGEQPQPQGGGKKKKKRRGSHQNADKSDEPLDDSDRLNTEVEYLPVKTTLINYEATAAGNKFIQDYHFGMSKKEYKASRPKLTPFSDVWVIIRELKVEYPDSTPVRYWQAVDKLSTKTFKLLRTFGMENKEGLGRLREVTNPIGKPFAPREIFSDEENQLFEEQRILLFKTFGHGVGSLNDRLYELKRHAWDMKAKYEHMSFVEYATNPNDDLRSKERAPFAEMADAVITSVRAVARRLYFFFDNEERIKAVVAGFLNWIDTYAKLKEQGADAAKLEKYLYLEQKFIDIVVFMAFDNLLAKHKKFGVPYDIMVALLKDYRDNLDDPDAERNFKYKVRGVTNITYKPKEYVFAYRFADLEPQVDYRPPEEIAAAEAEAAENKESPADEA